MKRSSFDSCLYIDFRRRSKIFANRIWLRFCSFLVSHSECGREYLGSDYGGWTICPDRIRPDSVVFSFGVGEDVTFDVALIESYGCTVLAYDPTPRVSEWLGRNLIPPGFIFSSIGLADYDGEANFFPPPNPNFVSHTIVNKTNTSGSSIRVKVQRLSTIMKQAGQSHIDILKMDIEGAEYEVISNFLDEEIKPTQILVEFHHFLPGINLAQTIRIVFLLIVNGYSLFSVSSSGHEYSFIRLKRGVH